MKKNNILILSAGRRVELVQDFQTEAARFSDGIGVFATDLNPHMSSACHVADRAFSVPRIDAAEYIDSIFELAKQHNIGLIVPTIDTELLKLAEARDCFEAEGIHIVISDAKLITLCRDKRLTAGLFAQYLKFTNETAWPSRVLPSLTTAAAPSVRKKSTLRPI